MQNEEKTEQAVRTQNSELLRHPLCHNLVFASVRHLTLKYCPLVDRDLGDEGYGRDQLLEAASRVQRALGVELVVTRLTSGRKERTCF